MVTVSSGCFCFGRRQRAVRYLQFEPGLGGTSENEAIGRGYLDAFSLLQIPIVSTYIDGGGVALNKLSWAADGRRNAIGSADGRVHIFDVGTVSLNLKR